MKEYKSRLEAYKPCIIVLQYVKKPIYLKMELVNAYVQDARANKGVIWVHQFGVQVYRRCGTASMITFSV